MSRIRDLAQCALDVYQSRNSRPAYSRSIGDFYGETFLLDRTHVVTFRGTLMPRHQGLMASASDWASNTGLYSGLTAEFRQAREFAREQVRLAQRSRGRVIFCGHSQGGFWAQFACAAFGHHAVSFNGPHLRQSGLIAAATCLLGGVVPAAVVTRDARLGLNSDGYARLNRRCLHVEVEGDVVSELGDRTGAGMRFLRLESSATNAVDAHDMAAIVDLLAGESWSLFDFVDRA